MPRIVLTYLLFVPISLSLLVTTTSCSTGESSVVLGFFFDGVDEQKSESDIDTLVLTKDLQKSEQKPIAFIETINIHEPYKNKGCDNCHETLSSNKLSEPQPTLCYNCHDDYSEQYAVLHGPVAAGYCTGCHNPHKTKIARLLKSEGQEMCYNCHNKKDVLQNEIHLEIEDTDCTECHNPHGGEDRFLM